MLAGFTACQHPSGDDPKDPDPIDNFNRTMLLEQFTSERCVNCPNGVNQIDAWIKQHPNVIWLGHHAGYSDDQWTIQDSKSIVRLLGVQGAPTIALDRNYLKASEAAGYNVHPYYLNYLINMPSVTTTASVRIGNTYDNGKLQIRVTGKVKAEAPDSMRLTVVIKENGLHGKQADGNMLAGSWDDYIHADVIRTFVSSVGGDTLVPSGETYESDYELQLDPKWEAKNCMVVAFLTDMQSLNVIQAAEKPVVEGTTGGADLPHGGVTPKAVPEGYPEGKYTIKDFIKADTVYFEKLQVEKNSLSNGKLEWHLLAWTTKQTYGSGQNTHIPFADIVFFTDATVTAVPTLGEYTFQIARNLEEIQANTAWAGNCDLEAQKVTGSEIYMVNKAQFDVGQIIPGSNCTWLIANGKLTFRENGFSVNATSAKGYPILLEYNKAN